MSDDQAKLFNSLRASTIELLGYDVDNLTAAQKIRVDRAIALRLVIDDAQARQMRGETIDVKEFVDASESLERMVGGNPSFPPSRFDGNARERLRKLIERTVLAGDAVGHERDAELMWREEQAAILAAGGDVEAAASSVPSLVEPQGTAPVTSPPTPPPRPLTDNERMDATNSRPVPKEYLADYQRQFEPWRAWTHLYV
jgi:hypothetical protein